MLGFLKNVKILTKISIPAILIALVSAVLVFYATYSVGTLAGTTERVVTREAKRVELALEAEALFNSAAVSEKNVILYREEDAIRANIKVYHQVTADVLATLDKLGTITDAADQRGLIDVFRDAVNARRKVSAQVFELALQNHDAEAFELSKGEGAKYRKTAIETVDKLIAGNRQALEAARLGAAALAEQTRNILVGSAASGFLVAFILLGWIALMQIARPLGGMAGQMERLAKGDLEIDIEGAIRRDEIGVLARSLEVFKRNAVERARLVAEQQAEQAQKERRQMLIEAHITGFEGSVRSSLDMLAAAATEMRATSQSMSAIAEETSRQATAVAAGSEEASANVETVAAATEELSSSVTEISRQVSQSASIASQAVEEANRTNDTVQGLSEAAIKIGDVVKLISNIAAQTNLLALNATIEAARAGEAGKGFAVVASEVKNLATQTAQATEDISSQVASIQQVSGETVQAIQGIAGTIGTMNEIASAIAAAVEEQGAATQEIARNVQGAALGTSQVSSSILGVNEAAAQTGSASEQVFTAADELSKQAEILRADVDNFLAKIRAA